jgi:hypothetical protein
MKIAIRSMMVAAALALVAGPASAGLNENAKIFLHLGPVAKNACVNGIVSDCRNATVTGNVNSYYYAFVGVGNYSDSVGVAGLQFGITYNDAPTVGVDIYSWTLCARLEFPMANWPLNNSGNLMVWDLPNCQFGPAPATAGYFYIGVYSPDRLALTVRPNDGFAKVADCNSSEDDLTGQIPSPLGFVDFQTGPGYNPCSTIVPVTPVTWSGVKTLLK